MFNPSPFTLNPLTREFSTVERPCQQGRRGELAQRETGVWQR